MSRADPLNLIWVMPAKGGKTLHRTEFGSAGDVKTQKRFARDGVVSPEIERVAERENLVADFVREEVAARGQLIISANVHRRRSNG